MVEKILRGLISKQNLICKPFEIGYKYLIFMKNEFALCVCTFVMNFRLALMILTLQLDEKPSSEMHFKQIIIRILLNQ